VKRSISRPLVGLPSPSSTSPTEGTITCIICQAVYAPSRLHAYLLQAPPIALESAFMSMCHFCFRCRRPSCPNCWDAVHAICGQCTRETHVPFRVETLPFEGTSHPSTHSNFPMNDQSISSSLVPVHPGRFQETLPSPMSTTTNSASQTHSPVQSAGTSVASFPIDIDAIATHPDRSGWSEVDEVATRPDRNRLPDIDDITTRPGSTGSLHTGKIQTHPDQFSNGKQKLIRILLAFTLLLAFLLLAIIVASSISMDVNLSIYKLLHIDIRAELTAIWHFLHSLF
jgi:hypothetical protein